MKSITYIRVAVSALIAAIINSSCTEKIDLKLKDSAPQVVIEGNISDKPGPYYVLVSKSRLFTQDNSFEGVPAAVVVISDDAGNNDTLTEAVAGLYQTTFIQGVPGRTYKLNVTVEGTNYESLCKMQMPVAIDSLAFFEEQEFQGGTRKDAEIIVRDPDGLGNNYRVLSYVNGQFLQDFDVYSDRLWDGKLRSFDVRVEEIVAGDTVSVDLLSIDSHIYDYFNQFNQNQNNFGSSASPANPDAVLTPEALGYFSAHSITSITGIVP